MTDLISRADAMRLVHSAIKAEIPFAIVADLIKGLPSADAVHKPDYSYEADMVRRLKKELSAEAEWIPCSERLPSEDGRYLVCMNWEYEYMEVLKWADGWNCYRCYDGKIGRENEIDGADIIAWMPLPTPYKGGGNE